MLQPVFESDRWLERMNDFIKEDTQKDPNDKMRFKQEQNGNENFQRNLNFIVISK